MLTAAAAVALTGFASATPSAREATAAKIVYPDQRHLQGQRQGVRPLREQRGRGGGALDGDPWSPNGAKIAFTSQRDGGDREIYVMNADGTAQTRLTTSAGFDENPTWSPDGKRIAFDTNRDGNLEIYAMNADGTGLTRVTNHPALDALPSFLPNGKIVFVSERVAKGQRRLFQVTTKGSSPTMLSRGAYDMSPDANGW